MRPVREAGAPPTRNTARCPAAIRAPPATDGVPPPASPRGVRAARHQHLASLAERGAAAMQAPRRRRQERLGIAAQSACPASRVWDMVPPVDQACTSPRVSLIRRTSPKLCKVKICASGGQTALPAAAAGGTGWHAQDGRTTTPACALLRGAQNSWCADIRGWARGDTCGMLLCAPSWRPSDLRHRRGRSSPQRPNSYCSPFQLFTASLVCPLKTAKSTRIIPQVSSRASEGHVLQFLGSRAANSTAKQTYCVVGHTGVPQRMIRPAFSRHAPR